MKSVGLLVIAVVATFGYTQAPDTLWTKTYGGTGNDVGNSIKQTSDGGYIIAGYTESFGAGQQDVWLLKTDANGDTVWTKTFGDTINEWAEDVHQTTDGGYIILAHANPEWPDLPCIWLIKTNSMGYITWTTSYTCYNFGAWGYDIQQTSDSGYVITGTHYSVLPWHSLVLYKTDADGDTVWCQGYSFGWSGTGFSVCETFDGGYIVGGDYTELPSREGYAGILLKTDADGNELWRTTFPLNGAIRSVRQTADSGFIACGIGLPSDPKLWIVRTDVFGDTLWKQTYGDSTAVSGNRMRGYSLDLTNDNAYIFTGPCGDDVMDNPDVFLFKTDENGDSLWCVVYGDSAYPNCGNEVLQTNDGGYIVVGFTESYGAGGSDVWIIKTEPDVGVEEQPIVGPVETHESLTATIFHGSLQLPEDKQCKVFDITGRVVEPQRIAPGIYFVEIDDEIVQKVIKIR